MRTHLHILLALQIHSNKGMDFVMGSEIKEYSVTERLPNNGQRVLCFGNKTFCCEEDMEKEKDWHEVTFKFNISSYRLKKEIPESPEETILDCYEVYEGWIVQEEEYGAEEHVIGVTKWKKLP